MNTSKGKLNSFLQKLVPNKTLKAKKTLGLNDESLVLAQNMTSDKERKNWALSFLRIDFKDLHLINTIKRLGAKHYALKVLDMTEEEYQAYVNLFKGKNKLERLTALIGKGKHHIRDFFNLSYASYEKYKKEKKSQWKNEDYKIHLLVIKEIINRALVTDSLELEELKTIAYRAFMAYHTYTHKATVKPQFNQQSRMAA